MAPSIHSLEALIEARLQWLDLHAYSPATIETEGESLAKFQRWCQQRAIHQSHQMTASHLQTYQRWLSHQKSKEGVSWSPRYQYKLMFSVQHCFRWAFKQGLLLADPTATLEALRLPKRLPADVLSQEELEEIVQLPDLKSASSVRDKVLLELLYATALRRQEVLRLRSDDLDHQRRLLLIRQGKPKKDRYVPISTRALQWISIYEEEARERLLAKGASRECESLLLSRLGRPLSGSALEERLNHYILQVAPEKGGACHLIRRSVATMLLERGCDIRSIQEFLGHRFLSTTQLYTKIRPAQLKAVYQQYHPSAQGGR